MRKTMMWALVTAAALAAGLGTACSDDSAETGGGDVCDISCDAVPTFTQLSWNTCTSCHSSDSAVRQTAGVPADSDYTTHAGASVRATTVAERVNDTTNPMPPNGSTALTAAEKEAFTKWGCCDAPP